MMLKKLTRETLGPRIRKGVATVSFTKRGLVILSEPAVKKLDLDLKSKHAPKVDVFQGDVSSEFCISKGATYTLRRNGDGGAVFNCVALSSLVIEKTWIVLPHTFQDPVPEKISFVICDKPVDDTKENSDIFALLRKKT